MLKSLTAKAVHGDTRATALVVDMVYRLVHTDAPESAGEAIDDDDLAILANYEKRIRRSLAPPDVSTVPAAEHGRQESRSAKDEVS